MRKFFLALAVLAVLAIGGAIGWRWLRDNKMPNFKGRAEFFIQPGTTAREAIDIIEAEAGIVNRPSLVRTFAAKEVDKFIKPGHYTISAVNSSVYVARMLNNGWQTPIRMTLSGNLRIKGNIAAKISSQMLVDSATVHDALNDAEMLASFGVTPQTVFSLFLPDTYEIYWTASIEDILASQKAAVDAFWTPENDAKAKALGLTRQQVSTLASIVKAETNHEPEMPKVAGVYLNRLRIGMPLQADPTIAFCYDYKLNRVLKKHLSVDSPYNTYKHKGLPPGPICVPSKACLNAVLNPDRGNGNLYFCANPDFSGTHVFARTLKEHNANATAFQRELNRRAALKKRGLL